MNALVIIWPRIFPAFWLVTFLSAFVAPVEVWLNVASGDYPPGARRFWRAAL